MAPKSAEDFLKKAKKIHSSRTEGPAAHVESQGEEWPFIPGYDNNDADDFDRRELSRERTRCWPQFGTLSALT